MAQTISELEKERAELLKQIEAQANQISSSRGEPKEHTLQDWLKAAEAVIPDEPQVSAQAAINESAKAPFVEPTIETSRFPFLNTKKTNATQDQTTMKNNAAPNQAVKATKASKASFFGVIIMLSLLLTILGVVYIAYSSIHKELQSVLQLKDNTHTEIASLKDSMTQLQEMVKAGGDPEKFETMMQRIDQLEKEVVALKQAQAKQAKETEKTSPLVKLFDKTQGKATELVTTDVLEKKLQAYTQSLDRKLERILQKLEQVDLVEEPPVKQAVSSEEVAQTISEPSAPVVPEVKMMNQPVVRLVEKLPEEAAPKMPSIEIKQAPVSSDVKWLLNEPALNYTLQLASMDERSGIEEIIRQKRLQGTRVIPQKRNGGERFVLVMGSFASRADASELAKQLKEEYSISPWIRKMKDISRLVQD